MSTYQNTEKIKYPVGGIGAGNFMLNGNGMLSGFSICHRPHFKDTPDLFGRVVQKDIFATVVLADREDAMRVLEGPINKEALYYDDQFGIGIQFTNFGLPRFEKSVFRDRFPFAEVDLTDPDYPLGAKVEAMSPFIPTNSFDSSLPVACLRYTVKNVSEQEVRGIYYFSSMNFLKFDQKAGVRPVDRGYVMYQQPSVGYGFKEGYFAVTTDDPDAKVNTALFRGGWVDPLSVLVRDMLDLRCENRTYQDSKTDSPGGSIAIPFVLAPGVEKTFHIDFCWYVPSSTLNIQDTFHVHYHDEEKPIPGYGASNYFRPWYASQFKSIEEVIRYMAQQKERLIQETEQFTHTFYRQDLPEDIIESAAHTLSILKSPTIMREYGGKLWCWEGSHFKNGSCPGNCDHVYNYAAAICHLFPDLERGMREINYFCNQTDGGEQTFRAVIPIQKIDKQLFYPAADGVFGNLIKLYREFIISGDKDWLAGFYQKAKESLDFAIQHWDPDHTGALQEAHHNTYDIEFYGADGMCTTFYLGGLTAFIRISEVLDQPCDDYAALQKKVRCCLEKDLFNGSYFRQKPEWDKIHTKPLDVQVLAEINGDISEDTIHYLKTYGPKYQYGAGCLSDSVVGEWLSAFAFLDTGLNRDMIRSDLLAIYQNNYKKTLKGHINPQRMAYAYDDEGGLLLCTWPDPAERPILPFTYSDEVWTGIEYQVSAHMLRMGLVEEALEILRTVRKRYDGRCRNPFDEIECGHFYARAMAAYSLIEGYTGVRFNAYTGELAVEPAEPKTPFTAFLSTNTGYGLVHYDGTAVTVETVYGEIPVQTVKVYR